jgi:hypothetical protein
MVTEIGRKDTQREVDHDEGTRSSNLQKQIFEREEDEATPWQSLGE